MTNCVLVVAAHTDDEALGCGGTIARHVEEGDTVYAVFMADGVTSRKGAVEEDFRVRGSAAEKAKEILGIKETFFLGLPDNRLDTIPLIDIVQNLELIIDRLKPNIVYTHHHGDLNIDHRITHQAVMTASRPTPSKTVKAIYAFEVVSSTEWATPVGDPFIANHYIDVSNHFLIKINALKAYQSEMRESPHSRSIEHVAYLAYHRGRSVGVNAAEAFMTIRVIR
jgi:LmbE family N-acetylglucosaminyl deacetylase